MSTFDKNEIINAPIINGDKCFFTRENYEKYSVSRILDFDGVQFENGKVNHIEVLPDDKLRSPLRRKQTHDLDKPENLHALKTIEPLDLSVFDIAEKTNLDENDSIPKTSSTIATKGKIKKTKKKRTRKLQVRNYDSIPYHYLHTDGIKYINELTLNRRSHVQHYPRYYLNKDIVALMSLDDIPPKFVHLKNLLTLGQANRILIPPKTQNILKISYPDIVNRYPILQEKQDAKVLHKQPVSRDSNAEYFAQKHSANVVISSSALKTLVASTCPDDSYSWEIPIVVREYTSKTSATTFRVVYVDKPFPRKQLTSRERSRWFYKAVLRCKFIHPHFKQPAKKCDNKSSNNKSTAKATSKVTDLIESTAKGIMPQDSENTLHRDTICLTKNGGKNLIVDTNVEFPSSMSESDHELVIDVGTNDTNATKTLYNDRNVECAGDISESEQELTIDIGSDGVNATTDLSTSHLKDEKVSNCNVNIVMMKDENNETAQNNVESMSESDFGPVSTILNSMLPVKSAEPTITENAPSENLSKSLFENGRLKNIDRCSQLRAAEKRSDSCNSDSDCPLVIDFTKSNSGSDVEHTKFTNSKCLRDIALTVTDSSSNNCAINDDIDKTNIKETAVTNTEKLDISPLKRTPSKYKLPEPEKIMTRSRAAKLKLNSSTEEDSSSNSVKKKPRDERTNIDSDSSPGDLKQDKVPEGTASKGEHLLRDIFGSSSSDEDEEIPCKGRSSIKRNRINRKAAPKASKTAANSSTSVKNPLDEIFELQKKLLGDGQDRKTDEEVELVEDDTPQFLQPMNNKSIAYNLWKLGDTIVLTRCSIDGQTTKKKKKSFQQCTLSPKIEYQSDFGPEVMTQSEINQEWISAFIRPESQVLRVRIQPFISKILSVDHINLTSYQRAKFTSSSLLHLVFSRLKRLNAGNYLLTHQEKQAFCHLLESVEDGTKSGIYDLHKSFNGSRTAVETRDIIEWLPLDSSVKFNYST